MAAKDLISPIQDPVHGYLDFNAFEQEVIDSPHFQRLHFILQNSTNYVSFPNNKNSRFIHSLGVAKLSGDLFVRGLNSSDADALKAFLLACEELLRVLYQHSREGTHFWANVEASWLKHLGNASKFDHRPIQGAALTAADLDDALKAARPEEMTTGPRALFIINTFWVAMRICGLVHDIGHLPMSHSFEVGIQRAQEILAEVPGEAEKQFLDDLDACKRKFQDPEHSSTQSYFLDHIASITGLSRDKIDKYIQTSLPIHEIRGLMIFDMMLRNPSAEWEDVDSRYRELIWELVQIVLFASSNKLLEQNISDLRGTKPFLLLALKRIVAGEVDSDRLDYTIRDGMAAGAAVGHFDLERIVSGSVLMQQDQQFIFGFLERSVPGLEQFFQQRYEGYKYIIFHRTAARSEAALHELIALLLGAAYQHPESDVAELLERFGYLARDKKGRVQAISSLLPSSQSNLVRLDDANLRTLMFELHHRLQSPECGDIELLKDCDQIRVLLEVVLFRNFRHIYNPLRGVWVEEFMRSTMDGLLPSSPSDALTVAALEFLSSGEELVRELRKKAKAAGMGLLSSFAKPKVYLDNDANPVLIRPASGEAAKTLGKVSPQLRNMALKRGEDVAFRLCFAHRDLKFDSKKLEECDSIARNFLEELMLKAAAKL